MSKLPEQTGLAYSWFSDQGHHLASGASGSLQRLAERLELSTAPDKACESASSCGLQPRTHRTCTRNLIDFNRIAQALHIDRPQGLDSHIALSQTQRFRRDKNGSRVR